MKKKLFLGIVIGLLIVNLIVSFSLYRKTSLSSDNRTVINNVVNGYDTDLTKAIDEIDSSLVTLEITDDDKTSVISGIVVECSDNKAYILTSYNGLDSNVSVLVHFDSGYKVNGIVKGYDSDTKCGLIVCDVSFKLDTIKFGDSSIVKCGDYVISVGGRDIDNNVGNVNYGITNGNSQIVVNNWIGTYLESSINCDINAQGGVLLNRDGEVLGLISSHPLNGKSDMSYALSSNEVQLIYEDLKKDSSVSRGSLGIKGRDISTYKAYEKNVLGINLGLESGVRVIDGNNELLEGDVITSVDKYEIDSVDKLRSVLYKYSSGDTVNVSVSRGNEVKQVSVVLK